MKALAGAALGLWAMTGAAHAEVTELQVGLYQHNARVLTAKTSNKEDGPVLDMQVNFSSPHILNWAFAPEPYVVAAANLSGDTSHAGVGLEWNFPLSQKWAFRPGLGYVIHNGEIDDPYPPGTAQSLQFDQEHVLLGSRDLFRVSFGLTRQLSENWSVQGSWVHLSHGQIIGHGRNQGLDELGVRLGYRFGN